MMRPHLIMDGSQAIMTFLANPTMYCGLLRICLLCIQRGHGEYMAYRLNMELEGLQSLFGLHVHR
jgi:hypothetical protein